MLPSITYRSRASGVRYAGTPSATSSRNAEGDFVDGANYMRDACMPRIAAEVAQVVGDSRVAKSEHQKPHIAKSEHRDPSECMHNFSPKQSTAV